MLKDDAKPVIMLLWKVPIRLKSRLKGELDKMVINDIIAPIQEPTDWVNRLFIMANFVFVLTRDF